MANNSMNDMNGTEPGHPSGGFQGPPPGGPPCAPPPGFTGPPPPGDYFNAADKLWTIVPPIIIVLGVCGNMLTVVILLRHMRKLSSTAIYLLTLAISDTLFLLNAPLRRWIINMWDEDVRHKSELGCKFSVYLTYSSSQLSSWILVAVTIERLVCVVWPHRVRLGCTPRLSVTVISVIVLIIFGSNAHIFYGFGQSDLPVFRNEGYCQPLYEGYFTFFNKTYPWIDFAVVFAIPFGILLVSNLTIIYRLRKTLRKRRNMSIIVKTRSEKSTAKDTRMVTIMLIILSVVFFICLAPVSIYFIYRPYMIENREQWMCVDIYEYIRLKELDIFLNALANLLGYINASFNFILYFISGSKYRAEMKALLFCRPGGRDDVFGSSSNGCRRRYTASTLASVSRAGSRSSTSSGGGVNAVDLQPAGEPMDTNRTNNNEDDRQSRKMTMKQDNNQPTPNIHSNGKLSKDVADNNAEIGENTRL